MGAVKKTEENFEFKNELENANSEISTLETNQDLIAAVKQSQSYLELSSEGNVINANENFLKLLGYALSDVQGKNHRMFYDSENSESLQFKDLWRKLSNGEPQGGEFKFVAKSGKEVFVVASFTPVMDKKGNLVKVIEFATDVTETKTELKVRTEIMNLTSIVSEANLRGDIMNINEKFIEVSKYSKDELIGRPHNTTRHPDMPKEVFKEMWATIGRGKMFRGVVKNRAKDGTPYYVDAVIAPILGDNGKPRKYLGVRYDITESEIERQNMKGVVRAIDASFAYVEFNIEGNILQSNKIFREILEYSSEEEMKGKPHRLFCDPSFVSTSEYAHFWPDLKAGQNKSGIYKMSSRSGKELWLQIVYSPVTDETGRVVKVVGIGTDVTAQQKMIMSIQETAGTLASASSELTATATEMSNTAQKTSGESQLATKAAEEVASGVQTVATNMEEMVASIKEIGRSTNESAQMAKTTLLKAQESNTIITKLGTSSQEIGDVIKVISSIAQQTNLLALNATIEAARAGEAGKGFAVVANEVKELAKQTAKATDDITHKIGAIQTDTKGAVEAIAGISQAVEKLNGLSGVVAAAVEEQTATTNEISRVVVESKKGVENIAEIVKTVSMAANASNVSSNQTLSASRELGLLAEKMSELAKSKK
ncbi:MAG: methyl-accepting chemotaxis protein [Bdellovibrio sp.]